jgi:hypothetical protein
MQEHSLASLALVGTVLSKGAQIRWRPHAALFAVPAMFLACSSARRLMNTSFTVARYIDGRSVFMVRWCASRAQIMFDPEC